LEKSLRNLSVAALAAGLCFSLAYAAEPPAPPPDADAEEALDGAPPANAAPHQDDAGRLVMFARELREKKGCAEASPAFRVIAGMGEGQEAAQHELAECLLSLKGANEFETALFRQEGEFWLTRAAFAGNARAQRRLAMDMASPTSPLHDPKGSLKWSLVYQKNPTADLYGYGPLPASLVPGLKSALSAGDIAEAEAFVATFAPLAMAKFEGPKRDGKKGASGARGDGAPQERRRRRPG
jgi:hypothetical protein